MSEVLLRGEPHTERRRRKPPLTVACLLLIAALAVAGRSAMITGREGDSPPGLTLPVIALAVAALVAALVIILAKRLWRDGRCWAALAGTSLVLLGSGFGQRQGELGVFEWQQGGWDTPGELVWIHHGWTVEVWWPVLATGLAFVIGAVAHAVVDPPRPHPSPLRALVSGIGAMLLATCVMVAAYAMLGEATVVSGRPVRRRGRRLRRRSDIDQTPAHPADLWRAAAFEEAESVTSFVELGQRLEAVGAPVELVARCGRSAREEARHAKVCTRLAVLYGAADAEVPPAPSSAARLPRTTLGREVEVVRLAVESFVDGVVGEGWAVDVMAAGTPEQGQEARLQQSLVTDERRHAELAADIVRWCVARSPSTVVPALRRAASRLPAEPPRRREPAPFDADELRSVGQIDDDGAAPLWEAHRSRTLAWIDSLLEASAEDGEG